MTWIQTYTGRRFEPLAPRLQDLDLRDIAHALSNQCRFGGHCRRFYSVAEHCLHVASLVAPKLKAWALLHDAAEAYLVDLPQPIKRAEGAEWYRRAEDELMAAVVLRYGLNPATVPAEVKAADESVLAAECHQAMGGERGGAWELTARPARIALAFLPPAEAERLFLAALRETLHRAPRWDHLPAAV